MSSSVRQRGRYSTTKMEIDAMEYQYAVIQFVKRPRQDIPDFVCVPRSWIIVRKADEKHSIVSYPSEPPSVTQKRVKNNETLGNSDLHMVVVLYEANSYEDAKDYIMAKKFGVADDDLSFALRNVEKRSHQPELNLKSILKKPKVQSMGNSLQNNSLGFQYPYISKISDYFSDSDNEELKESLLGDDFLMSMERYLLRPLQIPEVLEGEIPRKNVKPKQMEPPLSLNEDSVEVTKDVSPDPIEKFRGKDNFLGNAIDMIENVCGDSVNKLSKVQKLCDQSNKVLMNIKKDFEARKSKQTKKAVAEKSSEKDKDDDDSDEDDGEEASKNAKDIMRDYVLPEEYDAKDTRWTLKYRKKDPKLLLEELIPGSKVYIESIRLGHCKRTAKECKALARMLLVEIFTHNALTVCSLTGARANAFHNNGTYVRPGLDNNARLTMFKFVEEFGKKSQWAPFDKRAVICSVRSRIQEIRSKHARGGCNCPQNLLSIINK